MSPMRSYIETQRGPRGLAEVKVFPNTVRIEMDVEEGGRTKHKVFEIDRLNAPDNVRDGTFNVSLNHDEDQLWGLLPLGGKDIDYMAVYAGIDHEDGQPPMPRNDPGRSYSFVSRTSGKMVDRVDPPSRIFTMRWRILAGSYKGLLVPMWQRYLFAEYEDSGEAMVWAEGGQPWSSWAKSLLNTIRVAGFDPVIDTIPYSAEGGPTLSALDRILSERNKLVTLICSKSGFGNRIKAPSEGLTVEQFEDIPSRDELNDLTVVELKEMAREEDITGFSTMKKKELVSTLREHFAA